MSLDFDDRSGTLCAGYFRVIGKLAFSLSSSKTQKVLRARPKEKKFKP